MRQAVNEAWVEARILPVTESGCWLWTGYLNHGGYGFFRWRGKTTMAHRFVYRRDRGPIPDGLTLDHLCRVRSCVNPAHLEPVTNKENILRGFSPQAMNARKAGCKRGHEFDLFYRDGRRRCSKCVPYHAGKPPRKERQPFSVFVTYGGETLDLRQWAARTGIKYTTLLCRHVRGWSDEDILSPLIPPSECYKRRSVRNGN